MSSTTDKASRSGKAGNGERGGPGKSEGGLKAPPGAVPHANSIPQLPTQHPHYARSRPSAPVRSNSGTSMGTPEHRDRETSDDAHDAPTVSPAAARGAPNGFIADTERSRSSSGGAHHSISARSSPHGPAHQDSIALDDGDSSADESGGHHLMPGYPHHGPYYSPQPQSLLAVRPTVQEWRSPALPPRPSLGEPQPSRSVTRPMHINAGVHSRAPPSLQSEGSQDSNTEGGALRESPPYRTKKAIRILAPPSPPSCASTDLPMSDRLVCRGLDAPHSAPLPPLHPATAIRKRSEDGIESDCGRPALARQRSAESQLTASEDDAPQMATEGQPRRVRATAHAHHRQYHHPSTTRRSRRRHTHTSRGSSGRRRRRSLVVNLASMSTSTSAARHHLDDSSSETSAATASGQSPPLAALLPQSGPDSPLGTASHHSAAPDLTVSMPPYVDSNGGRREGDV